MSRTGTAGPVVTASRQEVRALVRTALGIAGGTVTARALEMGATPGTLFNWRAGIRDPTAIDLARLAAVCGLRLRLVLDLAPPPAAERPAAERPATVLAAVAARQRPAGP